MASRGGGGGGSGDSLRGWAESNARLLFVSVVGFGSGLLALVLAHRRGLLEAPAAFQRRKRGLSPEVQERIIVHMNKDHQAEVVLYARHFAGLKLANAATITAIDAEGMHLSVTVQNDTTAPRAVRVPFDRPVKDAADARAALTAMAQAAGNALGLPVKTEEEAAVLKLDALTDEKYGLARAEMGSKASLAGTVKKYDAHLFLVWRTAAEWPKNIEDGFGPGAAETLPQAVAKALSTHKKALPGNVKLNVAEAAPGDAEGTLLVFPLELCVRGVTAANADAVVQALFVAGGEPQGTAAARLQRVAGVTLGPPLPPRHLFVCSHLRRDKRCGLVGPFLVQRLREIVAETEALRGACPVRACSHVGGHAYAGNVLAFSHRGGGGEGKAGELEGHWFGYVSPVVAHDIVQRHLVKGELIPGVWRGQMGLTEDEQKSRCENCACEKTEL